MNVLYIDIDSLRPDHLGCYGYHRNTSPEIDAVAREGLRLTNCYAPDAPCLPSRTAMTTGRFGFHTGVVNHGGERSTLFNYGAERGFACNWTQTNWTSQFMQNGYHTVAFSPFAQRHGAWHWYAGFMEMHNTGGGGNETANVISPQVNDWIRRKGNDDKPFFMWVNVWDPHTPYRTPADFGNPFAGDPLPQWYNDSVRQSHWQGSGPHSAQEVNGYEPRPKWMYSERNIKKNPSLPDRQPAQINNMDQARKMFDNYDCGVAYADRYIGAIVAQLKAAGIYENTAIIISADHGENLGELGIYGDHQTADHTTHNIPMIIRWPGVTDARAGQSDDRLAYSVDIAACSLEWCGIPIPDTWDACSAADRIPEASSPAWRDALVLSQSAWCVQRAARWGDNLYIRTFHDAWHDYPDDMLFNLKDDPHEQNNLAARRPELVARGQGILRDWKADMLKTAHIPEDPLVTVLHEGGSFHAKQAYACDYPARLRTTGRGEIADRLEAKYANLPSSTDI